MRCSRAVVVMCVGMPVMVIVGVGNHLKMLYYNITDVHRTDRDAAHGFPIAMAMAAARNGNGTETAALNHTKRAGMNGISQSKTR